MTAEIKVTVWNEYRHERKDGAARDTYPRGIHAALAEALNKAADIDCRTATLDEPEHGLTAEVLAQTDVLTWWGHMAHDEVDEEIVNRVQQRVLAGMGLLVLHSGHFSKIFRRLMGTGCSLGWHMGGEHERLWTVQPRHPIAAGLPLHFELAEEETYGEPFDIPPPEELVFIGWFSGGDVFRSGCCYTRGNGRIFYFQPGHETFPVFHDPNIVKVLTNAVRWARPSPGCPILEGRNTEVLEKSV